MRILKNEEIIFKSENNRIILTNLRLREEKGSSFDKKVKSIMLENISACELRSRMEPKFLKWSILIFLILNGIVFLYNHYLINAIIVQLIFGPGKIPAGAAMSVFYISLVVSIVLAWLFFFSIKRVVLVYANGLVLEIQLKLLDDDIRNNLLSKIEEAKNNRLNSLMGIVDKNEV